MRIKALFTKYRPQMPFDLETKEIDAFFDTYDKGKSGMMSSNELKAILVDLKGVGCAISMSKAEVRARLVVKATKLRELAVVAAEGSSRDCH